jgi:hypothetical protein
VILEIYPNGFRLIIPLQKNTKLKNPFTNSDLCYVRISGNDNVNCHKAYEIDLLKSMMGNNFHDIKLKMSSKVKNIASITLGVKIDGEIIKIATNYVTTIPTNRNLNRKKKKKKTKMNFYLQFEVVPLKGKRYDLFIKLCYKKQN